MRHKHADFIHKWADGAELQRYDAIMCRWVDDGNPKWLEDTKFRIKPEPKPDVVEYYSIGKHLVFRALGDPLGDANLKLTFDGETGKLKAAEVLK